MANRNITPLHPTPPYPPEITRIVLSSRPSVARDALLTYPVYLYWYFKHNYVKILKSSDRCFYKLHKIFLSTSTVITVLLHRRIQDFVRGGGQGPLGPPGSAPDYLGEQFLWGGGGGGAKAPLAPPWIRACVILYINTISIKGILCEVSYFGGSAFLLYL